MFLSPEGPHAAKPGMWAGLTDATEAPLEWPGDDLKLFMHEPPWQAVRDHGGLEAGDWTTGLAGPLGPIAYLEWDPLTGEPLAVVLTDGKALPISCLLAGTFLPAQQGDPDPL